jgi:hypothetical protein
MLRVLLCLLIVSITVLVSSCFKEDELIIPHVPGNYITDTVAMTDSYQYQEYYNLSDSSVSGSNLRSIWDLGFDCSPDGWRVILNTSCFMKSAYLNGQVFGTPSDTTGAVWLFNPSNGSADSVAIGKWYTAAGNDTLGTNRVLLIDRGVDAKGISRGFRQLVIDSLSNGIYYFRIASYDGTNQQAFSISKNRDVNYALFSISDPSAVISEPSKLSWDLLFTQYTTLLYTDAGDPYPYLVTGVLLNPTLVLVAVDSITPFESITFETAQSMNFSKTADGVGYLWKVYNFDDGTYKVNPKIIYVIRDTKGFLYKLRFKDFYKLLNKRLRKGYPSFEYQKL